MGAGCKVWWIDRRFNPRLPNDEHLPLRGWSRGGRATNSAGPTSRAAAGGARQETILEGVSLYKIVGPREAYNTSLDRYTFPVEGFVTLPRQVLSSDTPFFWIASTEPQVADGRLRLRGSGSG